VKKRVALLGATGSIGKSALDVLNRGRDTFDLVLLSAHNNKDALEKAGAQWPGAALVLSGLEGGTEKLLDAVASAKAGITVNGISGASGLLPSMAAIEAGSDLALANKETLVMAGPLVRRRAAEKKVNIIPVDSEHSAIFHLIQAHGADKLDEIILTASGGPFRNLSPNEMKKVGPKDALAHPTWSMGPKITIDSASLANKGLEVIEAVRLFDLPPEKIKVVIHPQSVVHSMIRLKDGEIYAQLSRPDMRLPIHEALYWPHTFDSALERLDFVNLTLDFHKPDTEKFPMLALAYQAIGREGFWPCAYNSANEIAAAAFLSGEIGFTGISEIVKDVLSGDWSGEAADIPSILEADKKARELALSYIRKKEK
jgi:1-deoxy-D-xylulose-5-phosphate reductoisomerase